MRKAILALLSVVAAFVCVSLSANAPVQFDRVSMWFEPSADGAAFNGYSAAYKIAITQEQTMVSAGRANLNIRFVGASAQRAIRGEQRQAGVTNNYFGNDVSKWRSGIPHYGAVRIENVYDGIDVVFHGASTNLEYDFVLRPGADPRRIRLAFDGAEKLALEGGDVVLSIKGSELRQHAPVVYQDRDGARVRIDGRYKRLGRNQIAFVLGRYDRSQPLVIDPVLSYSTYLGTCGYSRAFAVAVDDARNTYVAGETGSNGFFAIDNCDIWYEQRPFVLKLDPTGKNVLFLTVMGTSPTTSGTFGVASAVALDASFVYVGGWTYAPDFPTTATAFQKTIKGDCSLQCPWEGFVAKLDAQTGTLAYSTFLGGTYDDQIHGIAVSGGSAIVTGETYSSDLPTTAGAFDQTKSSANTDKDAFVAKLNSDGSSLVYSTFLGGAAPDYAKAITVDGGGRAFVTGFTGSLDFPLQNAIQTVNGNGAGASGDVFVTVLNAAGSALDYSTYIGRSGGDYGEGIALDASNRIYVAGTAGSAFPFTNGFVGTGAYDDAFVLRLKPPAWDIDYSFLLGGNGRDYAEAVAVDSGGNAYVIGETESTDFPLVHSLKTTPASLDVFVAKIAGDGGAIVYSTLLSASKVDDGLGIAVDSVRTAHVVGGIDHDPNVQEPGFPMVNALQSTFVGTVAGFASRISITVPGPPTIGAATPDSAKATIAFLPPSDDGGDLITSYVMTCDPGVSAFVVSVSGGSSPIVVTGLTNGTTYACSVAAMNFAGLGPSSATVSVRPLAHGDANGDGTVSVGDVFYIINHLFAGGASPIGSGDVNADGGTTIGDVFYLVNHLFAGGPTPI